MSAAALLRAALAIMDELFDRTAITLWRDRVREVATTETPSETARAYRSLSAGSAPGTFHDLVISTRNDHAVTSAQEPFVNELLTTCQSIAAVAAAAIERDGDGATLDRPTADVAAEHAWVRDTPDVPNRWRIVVTGLRCATCDSRYQLDEAPALVAARRWSLTTVPDWIDADRGRDLVVAALDPDADPDIRRERDAVTPAFAQLGLPVIPLPYNRPDGAPNQRCPICGADTWTTLHWQLRETPLRLKPMDDGRRR
jgi:hypothetical protein